MCVAKTFSFTQIHSQFIVFFIFVIRPRGIFTHQSMIRNCCVQSKTTNTTLFLCTTQIDFALCIFGLNRKQNTNFNLGSTQNSRCV